jgi:hypothetical protein
LHFKFYKGRSRGLAYAEIDVKIYCQYKFDQRRSQQQD